MDGPAPDFWKPIGSLTRDDLATLLGRSEKAVVDYKRVDDPKDLAPEALAVDLCAFANAGSGRLVLGVEEGTRDEAVQLRGIRSSDVKKIRSKIRNAAHAVQPAVQIEIQEVEVAADLYVLVVEIRPAPRGGPHQYAGSYRIRVADGTTYMPHSSVVQAVLAGSHGSPNQEWSIGPPSSGFGTGFPFGDKGGTGWFFGTQLSIDHGYPARLFDVFDDVGESIVRVVESTLYPGAQVDTELERIHSDEILKTGSLWRRRIEATTDGRFAEFCQLEGNGPFSVSEVLEVTKRQLTVLTTLLSEVLPSAIVRPAVTFWGSSADRASLAWPEGIGELGPSAHVTEIYPRACRPSELAPPSSPIVRDMLRRQDNRLRVVAKVRRSRRDG